MRTTSLNLADHWQDVCGMGIRIALVRNHTLCLSKGKIGTISSFAPWNFFAARAARVRGGLRLGCDSLVVQPSKVAAEGEPDS